MHIQENVTALLWLSHSNSVWDTLALPIKQKKIVICPMHQPPVAPNHGIHLKRDSKK